MFTKLTRHFRSHLFLALLILFFLVTPIIHAQIEGNPNAFCNGYTEVNTAIGCIPISSTGDFIGKIVSWALGLAGGISLVLIIIAGFQFATSAGDPKRVKAAQELMTSAITGLVLIALSVVALNFLGVYVLGIGDLGFKG